MSYLDIVDMSKNRFFVLLENALHYLDNKDTIRAYLYILSAYNAVIDNIQCLTIITIGHVQILYCHVYA